VVHDGPKHNFNAEAYHAFSADAAARHKLIKWAEGSVGKKLRAQASERGLALEDTVLLSAKEAMTDESWQDESTKDDVVKGLARALANKDFQHKRDPSKFSGDHEQAMLDCVLALTCVCPKAARLFHEMTNALTPAERTVKRQKAAALRDIHHGGAAGLMTDDVDEMMKFVSAELHSTEQAFSIAFDEMETARGVGVRTQGGKKVIVGLQGGVVEFSNAAMEGFDPAKRVQKVKLAIVVPQSGEGTVIPFSVRPGGATMQEEHSFNAKRIKACAEYAMNTGKKFLGAWFDGVSKEQGTVWNGLEEAFSGAVTHVVGMEYFHNLKNLRNAATFLGTMPPWGGKAFVDASLLIDACGPNVVQVRRHDIYSYQLAAALIVPKAFEHLESQPLENRDRVYGTVLYLLGMHCLQQAVDNRNKEVSMCSRVFLLWLSLLLVDSFHMANVTKRNHAACCLSYIFLLTKHTPVRPWRASTHLLENYFGELRTCTHERELTVKQVLETVDKFRLLHQVCQRRGWRIANTVNSSSSSSGMVDVETRMDQWELPKVEPLTEGAAIDAGKMAAEVAQNLLLGGGWTTRTLSKWFAVLSASSCFRDLVPRIQEMAVPLHGKAAEKDIQEATTKKPSSWRGFRMSWRRCRTRARPRRSQSCQKLERWPAY